MTLPYPTGFVVSALACLIFGVGFYQPAGETSLRPVETAFDRAAEYRALELSYTMRFTAPGNPEIVKRYDAASDRWQLLSGDPSALDDTAREKLDNLSKSESVPGGLLYADYRDHLSDLALAEETEDAWLYRFSSPQAGKRDVKEGAAQSVKTRLTVDKDSGEITQYSVRSLKPFKPLPIAKLDTLVMEHDFEKVVEGAPPVMVRMYQKVEGERMFRTVDEEFTATFSDFERVD